MSAVLTRLLRSTPLFNVFRAFLKSQLFPFLPAFAAGFCIHIRRLVSEQFRPSDVQCYLFHIRCSSICGLSRNRTCLCILCARHAVLSAITFNPFAGLSRLPEPFASSVRWSQASCSALSPHPPAGNPCAIVALLALESSSKKGVAGGRGLEPLLISKQQPIFPISLFISCRHPYRLLHRPPPFS